MFILKTIFLTDLHSVSCWSFPFASGSFANTVDGFPVGSRVLTMLPPPSCTSTSKKTQQTSWVKVGPSRERSHIPPNGKAGKSSEGSMMGSTIQINQPNQQNKKKSHDVMMYFQNLHTQKKDVFNIFPYWNSPLLGDIRSFFWGGSELILASWVS